MTPRDSSAAADANPNASPPRSPDGLGERLRELGQFNLRQDRRMTSAMPWKVCDDPRHIASANEALVAECWEPDDAALIVEAVNALPALLDRIDTLTEQVAEAVRERDELLGLLQARPEAVRAFIEEVPALRSENARLTEQVRGAEGVVEAARFVTEGDLSPLYNALAKYDSLSIYNEGAAGGRSGSASPQSGDEVSQ